MTLAVFDLNDSAIGSGSNPDNWQQTPAFALLDKDNIVTGAAARSQAWLHPQNSFQHYWHQLNLSPLSVQNNAARHHADLAYAQLQQLYLDSGKPEQVILAVPGSFSREQMGLLLGLAKALPFQAIGLVDSAVAAVSQQPPSGNALHLDIQQHQSLITRIDCTDTLHSSTLEVINNLGLKQLMDHWAHHIADQFIRQYRYDPLHTANGEQQLYDQLPGWLNTLCHEPQVAVSLHTAKGNFDLNLMRDELLASAATRLQQLQQAVEALRTHSETLYLSHRIAQLPGIAERFSHHQLLSASAVLEGCLGHQAQICSTSESLSFITSLTLNTPVAGTITQAESDTSTNGNIDLAPSHLLAGHRALAIDRQLNLKLNGQGVERCEQQQADLVIVNNGSGVQLQPGTGVTVSAPASLQAGSVIELQGQRLQLICVEQQAE